MNLLSIGASLGVVVAVFQWGWLGGLLGVTAGPIDSFIPVFLFAIVFGLSMDYEVFPGLSDPRGVDSSPRRFCGGRQRRIELGQGDHGRRGDHGLRLPVLRPGETTGH